MAARRQGGVESGVTNIVSLPIGTNEANEDHAREVVEFFLDWEYPPSTLRIVLWDETHTVVEVVGGKK